MVSIEWGDQAEQDLEAAYRFIARNSLCAADAFRAQIVVTLAHLQTFPRMGRVVPEYNRADVREVFVQGYRLIYVLRDDTIEVLALHPSARPFRANLDIPDAG